MPQKSRLAGRKPTFYDKLEQELINLTPRTRTFKLLKQYLEPLGYWKNLSRGKPDIRHFNAQGHGASEGNSGGYTESDF